jgi:hypothetical protein
MDLSFLGTTDILIIVLAAIIIVFLVFRKGAVLNKKDGIVSFGNNEALNNIANRLDRIEAQMQRLTMLVLKLEVHDEHISIKERISAGEEYMALGGNGSTQTEIEYMRELYTAQLRKEGL